MVHLFSSANLSNEPFCFRLFCKLPIQQEIKSKVIKIRKKWKEITKKFKT